jgi:hypothetical protein
MTVTINWIDTPLEVNVDMSKLTWRDIVSIQRAQVADELTAQETIEAIVTKVTGVDAGDMPAQAFSQVVQAMMARAGGQGADQKN